MADKIIHNVSGGEVTKETPSAEELSRRQSIREAYQIWLTEFESKQNAAAINRDELIGAKAQQALDSLDADLATIDGGPTNAEVVAIVRRLAVRQRAIIQYLKAQLEL